MAEFVWRWRRLDGVGSDGDPRGLQGRFWVPDGYLDSVTGPYLRRIVEQLVRQWQHAPLADLGDRPPARLAVEGDVPPEMLPRPHIESMPLRYGHDTGVGDLLRLEVTSRWPAGSLAIPDDASRVLAESLGHSDMTADRCPEFWRYIAEDEAKPTMGYLARECPDCRCGIYPARIPVGDVPHWAAFCKGCSTIYWTRREAVVASVEVDLRPRRGLLPTTVTIGDREVPARVVVVTNELPGDIYDRTAFERDMAIMAARDRIARGEAGPEDTDATLFWSRPRRPRSG
jgi:hypothetical protein